MSLFDAIYARQSVDRVESISVESQVEICRKEAVGENVRVYTDRGFSGKNMDRPAFQQLMQDVESGKVRRVIVYRLDRISRSVLDFANVIDIFQKHQVDFVSTMEKFDTGTPIGKAMLMIVMIFAQLERETIQQRVVDAYAARSKRGFYMGGSVPYGFRLKEILLEGKHTKMYEPIPDEIEVIRLIFALYAQPQTSLGDVARCLEEKGVVKRNGNLFQRSRIRDIIVNPIYVQADHRIYDFFWKHGVQIINPSAEFSGRNGAYLYSGKESKTRKTMDLAGHTLVLAPHEGVIDAGIWLKCRNKCLNNKGVAKPVKAKTTWLSGKLKCAYCGYALTAKIYHCKTKSDNRYYLCSHKYHSPGSCQFQSVNANMVDEIVLMEMIKKVETFYEQKQTCSNQYEMERKTRIAEIEREILSLLDRLAAANEVVMEYINDRITALDTEKKKLYAQMIQSNKSQKKQDIGEVSHYMKKWGVLSNSDKIIVVDCLIESICATENRLEIKWKI